jgi:SAM-dependent methyltransferase
MLLAKRTGRTYGIESDRDLLAAARRRANAAHQPNIRIVEGDAHALPLRDGAVDIVLNGHIEAHDDALPAIQESLRVLRPGGRLVVIGYYGRDDVSCLFDPEVVARAREATQRRTGWWLRNGFKIKVVHTRLDLRDADAARQILPRVYGDRGSAYLETDHPPMPELKLALYHLAKPAASPSAPTPSTRNSRRR